MIQLLVVDDHEIVRAGVCRLLELESDLKVIGSAGSGLEAIRLCRKLNPEVLILDMELPDIDGIEVTRRVIKEQPYVKILFLTMYNHEEFAVRAVRAGARGYAIKGISQDEFPKAIRQVAEGGLYLSPSIMEKAFFRQKQIAPESPLARLSERELQVFLRLAKGQSSLQISSELCLSDSSIRTYKRRIMDKLDLQNLADLIRFAIRHNLTNKF